MVLFPERPPSRSRLRQYDPSLADAHITSVHTAPDLMASDTTGPASSLHLAALQTDQSLDRSHSRFRSQQAYWRGACDTRTEWQTPFHPRLSISSACLANNEP